jgi:hypothetical protein
MVCLKMRFYPPGLQNPHRSLTKPAIAIVNKHRVNGISGAGPQGQPWRNRMNGQGHVCINTVLLPIVAGNYGFILRLHGKQPTPLLDEGN